LKALPLRPLGFGELLDRAVTVFFRSLLSILPVLAVAALSTVAFSALFPLGTSAMDQLGRVSPPNADGFNPPIVTISVSGEPSYGDLIAIPLAVCLQIFAGSALTAIVAAAYRAETIRFTRALAIGVRTWPTQLLVAVTYVPIAVVPSVPATAILIWFANLTMRSKPDSAANWVAIAGFIVTLLLLVLTLAWVLAAYVLSAVAVVAEGANVRRAVSRGVRRALARRMRWRTLTAGVIVTTLAAVGTLPIAALGDLIEGMLNVPAASWLFAALSRAILALIIVSFAVVFSTDVRVRLEGLDLIEPP
jgi:hypothetical protein